jgi:hypothetical protein
MLIILKQDLVAQSLALRVHKFIFLLQLCLIHRRHLFILADLFVQSVELRLICVTLLAQVMNIVPYLV